MNYKYVLLASLYYDIIKLLVELFNLLIFMVCGWCIDLNDCDVVWSFWNPDRDESAGDGSVADEAIYNFFPYNKCYPILVFRVFSAVPDLVPLIHGSLSKTCPSDLGKAQDVPLTVF